MTFILELDGTLSIGSSKTPVEIKNSKAFLYLKEENGEKNLVYGKSTNVDINKIMAALDLKSDHIFVKTIKMTGEFSFCITDSNEGT